MNFRSLRYFTILIIFPVLCVGCSEQTESDSETTDSDVPQAKTALSPVEQGEKEGLIVFSSNRSGSWRIWSVNPDGRELRQLTRGQPDEQDVDPVFSPDGKTILFSSSRGGKIGIWKMPIDDPAKLEIICDGDQGEWSSDGKKIVFRRNERIIIRSLSDGSEKIISPDSPEGSPHCSGPSWSSDGKTIAFACRRDAGNALFTIAARGGEPVKIYDKKGACEPHWSPDGKLLVYETETHICTIQPDGEKNRLITYFGGVQRYPRWSPDGKKLIYCQGVSENGPWEMYIIPAAGGTPVKLLEGGSDMNPDWKCMRRVWEFPRSKP